MSRLSQLSDHDLLAGLDRLVSTERTHLVALLNHLNEVDRRCLYLEHGFSSLFHYCVSRLRYSRSAAGRRITCARLMKRFPQVGDMLCNGSANLTTLSMVSRMITPDNADAVLKRIRGKSQREVEKMVACYCPEVENRDRVRAIVVRERVVEDAPERGKPAAPAGMAADAAAVPESERDPAAEPAPAAGATMLLDEPPPTRAVQKHEIRFVAGGEFMKSVEQVRALLSHRFPRATFEDVFAAAMESFLEANSPVRRSRRRRARRERRKKNAADTVAPSQSDVPRGDSLPAPGVVRSRHIPDAVRDAVFVRDRGRCTYVGPDGTRCNSRHQLEVDHIRPYALGGSHSVSNLRLVCRAHNRMLAERVFGKETVVGGPRRE